MAYGSLATRVVMDKELITHNEARASPLKPYVLTERMSSTEVILLVAWRVPRYCLSSIGIPIPLSRHWHKYNPRDKANVGVTTNGGIMETGWRSGTEGK